MPAHHLAMFHHRLRGMGLQGDVAIFRRLLAAGEQIGRAGIGRLHGMVGGQFIDITATGTNMNLEQLQAMHALKTGALIRASLALG